jgi:uncharacterized protein (DUF4415 family)
MKLFCAYDIQGATMAIKITKKTKPKPRMTVAEFMDELTTRKPKGQTATKKPGRPPSGKVRVTMLLKPETIARFKETGPGWQARMSDALDAAASSLSV